MPEAWDEELGREVFGEVRPGVEKGLRSESRQAGLHAWKAALFCPLSEFWKEPFPALLCC